MKPEAEPASVEEPTPEEMRRVMTYIGNIRTPAKVEASRRNGANGGRPRLPLSEIPCTCGRGDALEGHPTTCPRGLAIRRREKTEQQKKRTAKR